MTEPLETFTVAETCRLLKISRVTLRALELRRELIPTAVSRGPKGKRTVRYRASELKRYLDRKTR